MIAEAVDAVHVLMWALAGWFVVFAAVGTLLVLAGCAAVAWVWRVVRRPAVRPVAPRTDSLAPLAAEQPASVPEPPTPAERHSAPRDTRVRQETP